LNSKAIKALVNILVWALTGLALFYLLQLVPQLNLNLHDLFIHISPVQWLTWLVCNGIVIGFSCLRWRLICHALNLHAFFSQLLILRQAGQLISIITPGTQMGGEPFQVYWLHKHLNLPLSQIVLSLFLDRCLEILINLSVLSICLSFLLQHAGDYALTWPNWPHISGTILVGLIALGGLIGGYGLKYIKLAWAKWDLSKRLSDSWVLITQLKPQLPNLVLCSMFSWLGLFAELYLLLIIVDIKLGVADFLTIMAAIRLAFLFPTPGALGSLEMAVIGVFSLLHLPETAALGLLVFMRLRDVVLLLIGFCCYQVLAKFTNVPLLKKEQNTDTCS
jgi:uncharacterized membrane protein YbhN (UPF0104 family)